MSYSERLKIVVTLSIREGSHGLEILRFAQNDSYKNVTLLKSFTIVNLNVAIKHQSRHVGDTVRAL